MTLFDTLIGSASEQLMARELAGRSTAEHGALRTIALAENMEVSVKQLVCAIGFHPRVWEFSADILKLSGFSSKEELLNVSEEYYRNDRYQDLSFLNLLSIYSTNRSCPNNQQRLRKNLRHRISMLEKSIGETINPRLIGGYKQEITSIYLDGLADLKFARERLNLRESGFRAMTGEVSLIAKSKLIPVGLILFSDSITSEEKRRLLHTGMIPHSLVNERLQDKKISARERVVLRDYLRGGEDIRNLKSHKQKGADMSGFASLLNASSLLARLQDLPIQAQSEPLKKISRAAKQLGLNHAQLVCIVGFGPGPLEEISQLFGLRTPELLLLRLKEIFTTDIYEQLTVDNILDIYALYEKQKPLIDQLLRPRLGNLEGHLEEEKHPVRAVSYKMEMRALYNSHILPKNMVQERMEDKSLVARRVLSNEVLAAVDNDYLPANNLFFMSSISPKEKEELISQGHISHELVKNRLQNKKIKKEERAMLENHL